MSRTYRRKSGPMPYWILENHISIWSNSGCWRGSYTEKISPKSKEGRKALARYHSDRDYNSNWKGWAISLYIQKPHRRNCKMQIQKALLDFDYELQLPDKPKKDWWS